MTRDPETKSSHLKIEYLKGQPRKHIKLTKNFIRKSSIELIIKFIGDGKYSDKRWRYFKKARELNELNNDFNLLMEQSSESMELSTAFVRPGSVNHDISWEENVASLQATDRVIQDVSEKSAFDIVFVLSCDEHEEEEPIVIVFQQQEDSSTSLSAASKQNEFLQEQIEKNRSFIASLEDKLERQGGVNLERQVIHLQSCLDHMEKLSNQKFKQHSEATSKMMKELSEAAAESLSQCTKKYDQKLDQLQKEYLKKASCMVSENQLLKNRLDIFGKHVRPIPAIQEGIATMSSNSIRGDNSPQFCYLYGMFEGGYRCWEARSGDKNKGQYLKASFLKEYAVTGIAIAPRGDRVVEYVTKFKVQTTTDVKKESDQCKWECIKTKDGSEEFESGITSHGQRPVHINFQRPVMARAIRFVVTGWYQWPSMRCEVFVLEKELMGALQ